MVPRLREPTKQDRATRDLHSDHILIPVHDSVEDVAEGALRLVALDEGDLDPRARLDVQHLHAVTCG